MPEATGGGDAAYDLTALGWLQFERVCTELLARYGVEAAAWLGEADRARWVSVGDTAATALLRRPISGPTVACVVWFPRSTTALWDTEQRVWEAIANTEASAAPILIVLTNARADDELRDVIARAAPAPAQVALLGRSELGRMIDAHPDVWLAAPSVLGVRSLGELTDGAHAASTFDLAAARGLAPVFVATAAYRRCCEVVAHHGFAVLTGPPEMGKTAAARMLGLVRLCQGWEVHECSDPDQLRRVYRRDRRQMFIADDAFGSTEYRADAAERWARDLDRILKHMDASHVLVWTSRPAPLHAGLRRVHRENGLQRFPKPAEVLVDAAALTDEERVLMLYRHAVAAELGAAARSLLRDQAMWIVADPHLTPERIRRLVWERLPSIRAGRPGAHTLAEAVAFEIARPSDAMAASLDALDDEHRAVLVAMLDAPPAPVSERDVAAAARRHGSGMAESMPALVDRLQDHFLRRVEPASVAWVHPSWRDLVVDRLAADPEGRSAFLASCGLEGALLALSVAGGAAGERTLPFLVEDADWDALLGHVGTLVDELDMPGRVRLVRQMVQAFEHCVGTGEARAVAELDALAVRILETILPDPIDAGVLALLQEWYALVDVAGAAPAPPDIAGLWVETLPTIALDPTSAADVADLETWTALVAILHRYDPAALERFGHPLVQEEAVARIATQNGAVLARRLDGDSAASLSRSANLLADLFPRYGTLLRMLGQDVWMRTAGARPAERERPAAPVPPPRPGVVSRVLADLEPPSPRRFWRRRRPGIE